MVIWLITVGEPLPAIDSNNPRLLRTGTLARKLAGRGHVVTWWTSTFDHYAKTHRATKNTTFQWNNVTIRMLHSVGYKRNVSFRRFFEHAGVARKFSIQARHLTAPDVILCSLPTIELCSEAVRFGLERNVPVLLDIRDLWPDVLIDVAPQGLRWLSRLLLFRSVKSATEALRLATGVIGISDGYMEWALKYAGRSRRAADAMYPLGYVAPDSAATRDTTAPDKLQALGIDKTRVLVWYVGSFGRQYDLAPVLSAARKLALSGNGEVQFVISGDGELGRRWRSLAEGLGNVVFTGWIDADEINWLRARASIGLQPYVAGAPQGLANKLFEYLSAGIPVLSSLAGENAQLIDSHACGLSYEAGNTEDFMRKLSYLLEHTQERQLMGLRGKALFERQFDGNIVFDGLADHLESVASSRIRAVNQGL